MIEVHDQHKARGPKELKIAIIIVSTTCFKEKQMGHVRSDKTLPIVESIIEKHSNISVNYRDFVSDSKKQIKKAVINLLKNDEVHAILFSGGTGLSPKDITLEAIKPLIEKEITGFGELFRYLSYKEIGSSAMLSRALAGVINKKIIFLLPGSPKAVKLALEKLIIPELGHIIYIINKKE
ncbi:MAG: MogA/MoaB family molybdenum cofactor biosynthesis protein [Promethearchaeota archaeon]